MVASGMDMIGVRTLKFPKHGESGGHKNSMANRQRDEENKKALTDQGWNVLTVWECELKVKGTGRASEPTCRRIDETQAVILCSESSTTAHLLHVSRDFIICR